MPAAQPQTRGFEGDSIDHPCSLSASTASLHTAAHLSNTRGSCPFPRSITTITARRCRRAIDFPWKFRLLRDHLVTLGMTTDAALLRPSLCSRDILTLAHDADYVARYCSGEMGRDELRRLGLPRSPGWRSAPCGGRRLAAGGGAGAAARSGLPSGGGTHHAHRDHASGFCIFNDGGDRAVPAGKRTCRARADLRLRRAQGDGTARITENDAGCGDRLAALREELPHPQL